MSKKYLLAVFMLIFAVSSVFCQKTATSEPIIQPRIAFVSDRTGYHQLYIMNADGTDVTQITDMDFGRAISSIDCSPIEDHIVIGNATTVYVFSVSTGVITTVTNDGIDPSWSPTGNEISYTSGASGNFDIFRTTITDPEPINVSNYNATERFSDWSPDGTKILFSSTRENQYGIFTMNPDGTQQTRLTSSAHLQDLGRWSPDGNQITFVGGNGEEDNIYVMSATGTNITRLTGPNTSDWEPQWSPDGSQILFSSYRDDHQDSEIYIMNANGSNPTRLTNEFGEDFSPCWLIEDAAVPSEKTPVPTGTAASG